MANRKYKCVFMGALSNSTILSNNIFLCNNISSTEAPGIESSGSKGNSHHAQIKVSSMISQHEHFSVKHFLSAGGIHCNTGKRGVTKHKGDCITVLVKLVVEVSTLRNKSTSHSCSSPSEHGPRTTVSLSEESYFIDFLVSFTPRSSQEVIFCKDVQKTTGRNGEPLIQN